MVVSPGLCKATPCTPGSYEFSNENAPCKSLGSHVCLPCSDGCPAEMYQQIECTGKSDHLCDYNCLSCYTAKYFSNYSALYSDVVKGKNNEKYWSMQLPVIIVEIIFAVFLLIIVTATAIFYVCYRLRNCQCSAKESKSKNKRGHVPFPEDNGKIRPDTDELKIRRAQTFSYEELERATNGFKEESIVGKGSFSCVYKGILKNGTVVAVKNAIISSNKQRNSKEFHTKLDLLSRLNHAHFLNLLGYCKESEERLLVYEFMAHVSLHQHLHRKKALKEQLDWVRHVTIAVEAARGIKYLHGYACLPVIHQDIKSSNILIDEEHNARVADFGLSLLGPSDCRSPLVELPTSTLGYLDPEYYRLHYLTTKSDVYSFGIFLLEILNRRKAIDMQYEDGNIVEWVVPLIKSGSNLGSGLEATIRH